MRYLLQYKRMVEGLSLYSKLKRIVSKKKHNKVSTIKYVQTQKEPLCIYTAQRASFLYKRKISL